ncbi:hypothetical protein PMZ80_002092 [Knufia obscura]|uniref:Pet127-domain-containing protein n=2 Tax=Knufia TaxID=430999 RepID=A0AAN8EM00_9EURO|nr:hypothetical protein PMZ80_002092 [Knufia obscura]KAK5953907.1 hypothetical protein OHC33_005178 [Knufia fluminis]
MRSSASGQPYVCLSCLIRTSRSGRTNISTNHEQNLQTQHRHVSFSASSPSPLSQPRRKQGVGRVSTVAIKSRTNATSTPEQVKLNNSQISKLGQLHSLRARLQNGLSAVPDVGSDPLGVPIDKVLAAIKPQLAPSESPSFNTLEQVYAGKPYKEVSEELSRISKHRKPSEGTVTDQATISLLDKLGIVNEESEAKSKANAKSQPDTKPVAKTKRAQRLRRVRKVDSALRIRPVASTGPAAKKKAIGKKKLVKPSQATVSSSEPKTRARKSVSDGVAPAVVAAPKEAKSIEGALIPLRPIETEETPKVPRLSFDLARVLFNPGVYHLQDPRSRVYNFDPYLEKIMPVTEFNFDALNPYITSSQDETLRSISEKHNKRYVGSSSSMSAAMSHFHFLLSAWRPVDPSILSQKITGLTTFTAISRTPSSIYLRWKNGTYAVDADKEYDTPNILMMQGKSMEKLLTLEKEDFEKYRKPKAGEQAPAIDTEPEAYHYSTAAKFLLRSQLDAYDPRLPGTGMFDLKTRAVAGIRMIMREHEVGMGYQIKDRFGMWESFDREYYDMIRSAFLKYSLQVRMGRMDGIFVAYHNIARIFGFQYVSLQELDMALHGQADRTLGDREFRMTIKLMSDICDEATKEYPEQSLRIMFETRPATKGEPNGFMRIFAEPMTDEDIDKVQRAGKNKVDEYEKSMAVGINPNASKPLEGQTIEQKMSPSTLESNAADEAFLDEILGQPYGEEEDKVTAAPEAPEAPEKPVASWTLHVYNEVNDEKVARPKDISAEDRWIVKYVLAREADSKSRPLYNAARARRAADLVFDDDVKRANVFTDRLRMMSESGRMWREEQDAQDSQREKVMLYSPEQ